MLSQHFSWRLILIPFLPCHLSSLLSSSKKLCGVFDNICYRVTALDLDLRYQVQYDDTGTISAIIQPICWWRQLNFFLLPASVLFEAIIRKISMNSTSVLMVEVITVPGSVSQWQEYCCTGWPGLYHFHNVLANTHPIQQN